MLEFVIDFECPSGGGEPSSRFSSELVIPFPIFFLVARAPAGAPWSGGGG